MIVVTGAGELLSKCAKGVHHGFEVFTRKLSGMQSLDRVLDRLEHRKGCGLEFLHETTPDNRKGVGATITIHREARVEMEVHLVGE